ncbi:hypothetical protein [Chthonomonas calidirosea]|nr:hypothetical protein [Chthonomonas calidirosea]
MMKRFQLASCPILLGILCALKPQAHADVIGLNQIPTPPTHPKGVLSITLQAQDAHIGTPWQTQFELGLTKNFSIDWFHNFTPTQEDLINFQYALVQLKTGFTVTTGLLNWPISHGGPQELFEFGTNAGRQQWVLGAIYTGHSTEPIVGFGYQISSHFTLMLDHQGGGENASTIGGTYYLTPNLSLNPAVYISNHGHHRLFPYAVITWSVQLFK